MGGGGGEGVLTSPAMHPKYAGAHALVRLNVSTNTFLWLWLIPWP